MIRNCLRILVTLLILFAGCKEKSPDINSLEGLSQFNSLPGVRAAQLPGLQDEVSETRERAGDGSSTDR